MKILKMGGLLRGVMAPEPVKQKTCFVISEIEDILLGGLPLEVQGGGYKQTELLRG